MNIVSFPLMKHPSLRIASSLRVYAKCICLLIIITQLIPPSSSFPCFSDINLVDSFMWKYMHSFLKSREMSSMDLQLYNLSVHRVRYVDNMVTDFVTAETTKRYSMEVSSVIVTWEDHPLAAQIRSKDTEFEEEEGKNIENGHLDDPKRDFGAVSYSYEVQIWVSEWGLDGLWNPANKKVTTRDPFLVLSELPLGSEMNFRVRIKAEAIERSMLGFFLPRYFFSTEIAGNWSEVVTLSPTREEELEAIVTSLTSNKLLLLLLTVCIGSGFLVVAQLYYQMTREQQLLTMQPYHPLKDNPKEETAASDDVNEDSDKLIQRLEQEIRNLRQELADSEDEVRHLMLFRGYGIESLALHELDQLEHKLKHTLKRIHQIKKYGTTT